MRGGQLVMDGLIIEGKCESIAAQFEIMHELAADYDGRHIWHQIHRGMSKLPQLAILIPAVRVDRHPGVFVQIQHAPRNHIVRARRDRTLYNPDAMQLIPKGVGGGVGLAEYLCHRHLVQSVIVVWDVHLLLTQQSETVMVHAAEEHVIFVLVHVPGGIRIGDVVGNRRGLANTLFAGQQPPCGKVVAFDIQRLPVEIAFTQTIGRCSGDANGFEVIAAQLFRRHGLIVIGEIGNLPISAGQFRCAVRWNDVGANRKFACRSPESQKMIPYGLISILRNGEGDAANSALDPITNSLDGWPGARGVAEDVFVHPSRGRCGAMRGIDVHSVVRSRLEQLLGPLGQAVRMRAPVLCGDGKQGLFPGKRVRPRALQRRGRRIDQTSCPCGDTAIDISRALSAHWRQTASQLRGLLFRHLCDGGLARQNGNHNNEGGKDLALHSGRRGCGPAAGMGMMSGSDKDRVSPDPTVPTFGRSSGYKDHYPQRMAIQGINARRQYAVFSALSIIIFMLSVSYDDKAHATEIQIDGGPSLRLNNTVRYTAAGRVVDRDPALTAPLNWGDGDRNFAPGMVSNRLDLMTGLDIDLHEWGGRVSVAGWYDAVYRRKTDAGSGANGNSSSTAPGQFPAATRRRHGRDLELRDAFLRGGFNLGEMPITLRMGRQTLAWGEALFHDPQSIASAQAPVDYTRAITAPGTYRNDLYRPVAQAVATIQPSADLAISAYQQFEWRPTVLPASGSYFSYLDHLGSGGDRFLLTPDRYLARRSDLGHSARGQFGLAMHVNNGDVDYGLYALRFNSMEPHYLMRLESPALTGGVGYYRAIYPGGARLYGASISTVVAEATLAGEVSLRRNMPLMLPPINLRLDAAAPYNGFVRGSVAHGQMSISGAVGRTALWDSADISAEAAFDHVVDNDPVDTDRPWRHVASRIRLLVEPRYFRVLPNVDITLPVGIGYNLSGRSLSYRVQNAGGGDMQIGVAATYDSTWKASLTLTRYIGSPREQWLTDRDHLSFSLERTF